MISIILSIIALAISIFAAIQTWLGWKKNRSIYHLEFVEFMPDKIRESANKQLLDKLNSGDYTVLHAEYREAQYNLLIGKLTK